VDDEARGYPMFSLSFPTVVTSLVVAGGITAGTVSVALPAINQINSESIIATSPSPSPTPTGFATGAPNEGQDSSPDDLSAQDINSAVAPGLKTSNLPMGSNVVYNSIGVVFTFRGTCTDPAGMIRVVSNTGSIQSSGGAPCTVGKETFGAISLNWDVYTTNAYCYSVNKPGSSAYRLEAHGLISQWASIPEEFKVCETNAPPPPPPSAPETPAIAPAPQPVPELVPEPSSPTPSDSSPSPSETPAG